MTPEKSSNVTQILREAEQGEPAAMRGLAVAVYDELRGLAAKYMDRERQDHTLQPTALVHEAFLKLVDQTRVDWQGRTHFFAVGAEAMRRVLVDHARRRGAAKRGGDMHRVQLDEDLAAPERREQDVLVLDDVLNKLAELDPRQAKMVELRFFGGLSVAEAADAMEMSKRTAEREWTMIRAWLRRELSEDEP
jgi:RNA polymerase sigma-70 factor (ECF subfamily)